MIGQLLTIVKEFLVPKVYHVMVKMIIGSWNVWAAL